MNRILTWLQKIFGHCKERLTELGSEGPFPPDEQFIKTMANALDKRASIEYVESSYSLKSETSFCKGPYIIFKILHIFFVLFNFFSKFTIIFLDMSFEEASRFIVSPLGKVSKYSCINLFLILNIV